MRVIYTSSERFMNEMIACIRTERMEQFSNALSRADVLLVDDIQLLGQQGAHPGRTVPHLQRTARSSEADRHLERLSPKEYPACRNACVRASSGA